MFDSSKIPGLTVAHVDVIIEELQMSLKVNTKCLDDYISSHNNCDNDDVRKFMIGSYKYSIQMVQEVLDFLMK